MGDWLNNTLIIVGLIEIISFLKKSIKKDTTSFVCNSYKTAASESFKEEVFSFKIWGADSWKQLVNVVLSSMLLKEKNLLLAGPGKRM